MLSSYPVRLWRRESVSLGRFQNCNLLEMDHFSEYGVEDELDQSEWAWNRGRADAPDAAPIRRQASKHPPVGRHEGRRVSPPAPYDPARRQPPWPARPNHRQDLRRLDRSASLSSTT